MKSSLNELQKLLGESRIEITAASVTTVSSTEKFYVRDSITRDGSLPKNYPSNITVRMIDITWDWIVDVGLELRVELVTLYLARRINAAAHDALTKDNFQLHFSACFVTSSMITDAFPVDFTTMADLAANCFTEQDIGETIIIIMPEITCELFLNTSNAYRDSRPDRMKDVSTVARLVGLFYLYSDDYYRLESHEIALFALYYATSAMQLPFRLLEEMQVPQIRKPALKRKEDQAIRKILSLKAKKIVDVNTLLQSLE